MKLKIKLLIAFAAVLLLSSCTTPKKTVPDDVIPISGYINPKHIILPAGEKVVLKDRERLLIFVPEQDVNYTLTSEYIKLEQKYLILLEDYVVTKKNP